jgi:IS30 family transposase
LDQVAPRGHHQELNLDERIAIRRDHEHGASARTIGLLLNRAGSTISRELLRMSADAQGYRAKSAHRHAQSLRQEPRRRRKLSDEVRWH